MVKAEIIKYIEDNSDLAPEQLLAQIQEKFEIDCQADSGLSCFCKALKQTIDLYQQNNCEIVDGKMHQRLIERIENECK